MDPHYSYFGRGYRPGAALPLVRAGQRTPRQDGALIGHLDTVGVSDRWDTDPFVPTEIDGKVYGRGAMDMKGGLAAILETLTYYAAHRDTFRGKILACFVADEEGLSKGSYQLVAEDVIHANYAIMGECRYDNVAVGFRGRYSFEVTVHGQTAHASHYPEVGENALISGGRLAAAIEALSTLQHPHLKHGTWCVRYMEGGNPGTLVVPERCYIFVDRYVVPAKRTRPVSTRFWARPGAGTGGQGRCPAQAPEVSLYAVLCAGGGSPAGADAAGAVPGCDG